MHAVRQSLGKTPESGSTLQTADTTVWSSADLNAAMSAQQAQTDRDLLSETVQREVVPADASDGPFADNAMLVPLVAAA
jgi:hypothetical protein